MCTQTPSSIGLHATSKSFSIASLRHIACITSYVTKCLLTSTLISSPMEQSGSITISMAKARLWCSSTAIQTTK